MLYPKIGIRPVIDGRWGGVRESLEAQTMAMAENAAKLISENLKYPDGKPVQCVVGCTTIGGGAEAARVAEQFSTQNVTATLSVTPCWCYGTETFDMDPTTIKAVWGFNGTERPGAVYLAAVLAAHAQRGLPAFSIYGHDVQDANDTSIPADVASNGFIHLINSGATALDGSGACVDENGNHVMKPFWEMKEEDIKNCLEATDWCRADYEYFRGGGYSSHFRCHAEMPVTMLRFNIIDGVGPVLQIAEGWTAYLPV